MSTKTARLPRGAELLDGARRLILARHGLDVEAVERRIRLDLDGVAILDALAAQLDDSPSGVVRRALDLLAKQVLRP